MWIYGFGNGLGFLLSEILVLAYSPVENVVLLEAHAEEEIVKDLFEVRIVRFLIETKVASIVEVGGELFGKALTKMRALYTS